MFFTLLIFAPSVSVSVKFNTTVYGNVGCNKKNICTKQADPLYHVDKSVEMRKKNGTKRNQGTIRIDTNVRLIAS